MGMVVRWWDQTVVMPPEPMVLQEMVARAALGRVRSALLVALAAEAAQEVGPCRMLALARESTSRRQHISMWGMVEILMSCGRGEISLASSRAVAF